LDLTGSTTGTYRSSSVPPITEKVALQFRAEFFNLFNHTQFTGVNASVGAAAFGQVTSTRDPRITQLALRVLF